MSFRQAQDERGSPSPPAPLPRGERGAESDKDARDVGGGKGTALTHGPSPIGRREPNPTWMDRMLEVGRVRPSHPAPFPVGKGVLRQAQDERGSPSPPAPLPRGERGAESDKDARDVGGGKGTALTPGPSPTRGEGVLRQAQDARGSPSPQPSPIKGEGVLSTGSGRTVWTGFGPWQGTGLLRG